jgi:hypothetical protein
LCDDFAFFFASISYCNTIILWNIKYLIFYFL